MLLPALLYFTSTAIALPSGCSTYVECTSPVNAQGKKNGLEVCFDANDKTKKMSEWMWRDGVRDGPAYCLSQDGQSRWEENFKGGRRHGKQVALRGGEKLSEDNYRNDELDGLQFEYASTTEYGKEIPFQRVSFYKDGKKHGYTLKLSKAGELESLADCEIAGERRVPEDCAAVSLPGYEQLQARFLAKDAQDAATKQRQAADKAPPPTGERNDYYPEGQIRAVSRYKDNSLMERTEYYQNGKKKSHRAWKQTEGPRQLLAFQHYYDNGRLRSEGETWSSGLGYRGGDGALEGEYRSYDRDGSPLEISRHRSGKREGASTSFEENLRVEETWSEDKRVTRTEFDRATGKKLRFEEYMPDGSLKNEILFK